MLCWKSLGSTLMCFPTSALDVRKVIKGMREKTEVIHFVDFCVFSSVGAGGFLNISSF